MDSSSLDQFRHIARLQGYTWTDEEIERLRPQIERGLALVERLSALTSRNIEPATHYRMF